MSIFQSVVESAIGKLGDGLIQAFIDEAIFLRGVGGQVREMEREFRWMQSFLKDADAKQLVDKQVKNWVGDVQKVAYDAEDAIDTFACEILPLQERGCVGTMKRYALIFIELKALHKLGSEIERIKINIRGISERRSKYGIESISQGKATSSSGESLIDCRQRLTSPHFQDSDFVGFEGELESLIKHLTNGEELCCVVSLVGMGGLGKTTLAKKAYSDETVKNHFSTQAWISVSQQYSVRQLLQAIGKCCAGLSMEAEENTNDLRLKISEYLKERRYLIVLDNIWEKGAWDAVKDVFADDSNGSRVVLTTRKKAVALHADIQGKPHELPLLKEDDSWKLFCKKAFPGQGMSCPPDLEQTARDIVKCCRGLPLAIVLLGGLLSKKKWREWGKVLNNIHWRFSEGQAQMHEILSLSYDELPYTLKPCFLYLGAFPEAYNFPANQLIRMWAAEGFLQDRGNETMEEVGEDVLMELISRGMIQVAEINRDGLIQSCCVHDLLWDFILSQAKEEMFLDVGASSAGRVCRLAVHGKLDKCDYLESSASHLRGFFSLPVDKSILLEWAQEKFFLPSDKSVLVERAQEKFLFTRFKLLRVLHLESVQLKELPNEIGNLVHLRYIYCHTYSMRSLPSSMVNLRNLQTLGLYCTHRMLYIPSAVEKMLQRLRYLLLHTSVVGVDSDEMHSQLKSMLSENFFNMIEKSKLSVSYGEGISLGHHTESSLVSNLYLIDKNFIANSASPALPSPPLPRPFYRRTTLSLYGKITELPELCDFPHNIASLSLQNSRLERDPIPLLEKLETLIYLALEDSAYLGEKMTFSAGGFPRLQTLKIDNFHRLKRLIVEEGSMPYLLDLLVASCKELEMIPEGLKHLTNLQRLTIHDMTPEFKNRLQREVGEDWQKVQRIPSIRIS